MSANKQVTILLVLGLFLSVANINKIFAQDKNTAARQITSGQKLKIQGIVVKRGADSFKVLDNKSLETDIVLTDATKVRTHYPGIFRGGTSYAADYIVRGLRLQVEGVGNTEGQLVANLVKFDEQDLRTAQALQAYVDPVEQLGESNQQRITATEKNAEKMAGQIDENTSLATAAQASATRARITADSALKSATEANKRIGGLGLYDTLKVITVYFPSGSSVLLAEARASIDDEADWAAVQNTNAWVVEVVGFADSSGGAEFNKQLSEERSKAVIDYLVMKHALPLNRVIRPFGFGSAKAAAENATRDGRAKNRRVEIRVLVNRGIAGI
jgi:outer membrane protein OmpA-like peptidoglycan-associated protein